MTAAFLLTAALAASGGTLDVAPGTYVADLVIDRPVRLIGHGRPTLAGTGAGTVIRIRVAGVTLEGLDIDGREGGDVSQDSAGIHVAAPRASIRDCRIRRAFFGVYLHEADGAVVERTSVTGLAGREPGDQGSGIHVFHTRGFRLIENTIQFSRDGLYIQSSPGGVILRNRASDLRYGLHYMYSDDNRFEDNVFERSAAGAAIMYSRRLEFRRNRFLHNRGYASVGLLVQACDDLIAEHNLVADNARGVFLEGSHRASFHANVIAESDIAVVLYDSMRDSRLEDNLFLGNLSPLQLVGRKTDTVFDRNYWSDSRGTDLDGDGVLDAPHRLSSVFDHLRGNLAAADLFAQGLGAAVLARAEDAFPVLDPTPVVDAHPRSRPFVIPELPRPDTGAATHRVPAAGASLAIGAMLSMAVWRLRS